MDSMNHDHVPEEHRFYPIPGLSRALPVLCNSGLCWSGALQGIEEQQRHWLEKLASPWSGNPLAR